MAVNCSALIFPKSSAVSSLNCSVVSAAICFRLSAASLAGVSSLKSLSERGLPGLTNAAGSRRLAVNNSAPRGGDRKRRAHAPGLTAARHTAC